MLDATRSIAPARLISTSSVEYIDDVTVSVMIGTKPAGDGTVASGSKFAASLQDGPDFIFLPERFALSPVVPAYRYGDQAFQLIVDWTVSALIEAEALGVVRQNVIDATKRSDMRAEQLLGQDFATAQALGIAHDWAVKVIGATGNYGEIFQRTTGGPYHLDRGLNALWINGGLMRPLPMQ